MKVVIAYIGVILIWSTTPLGIKLSIIDGDLLFPLVLRTVIGLALSILCLAFIHECIRFTRQAIMVYLSSAMGVVGALSVTYWSAQFIPSGLISVLYGLSPIFAGVLAMPILKEPFMSLRKLFGVVFAMLGLAIIFYHEMQVSHESWKGVVGIAVAVFMYALSAVLVKRYNHHMTALSTNAGSLLFACPMFAVLWFVSGQSLPDQINTTVIYATLYLGVIGSFVGFVLYFYVLKNISAASVMLIPMVTPALAMLLGNMLNGEVVGKATIIGSVFVLSGLLIYQYGSFRWKMTMQ